MQIKGKRMKQTWENDESPNFGTNFVSFGPSFQAIILFNFKKSSSSKPQKMTANLILGLI